MSRHNLFDELEHNARQQSQQLENLGKLPYGFTAEHYPLTTAELLELRRLKAAMELAEDADTYVALARGRPLPQRWYAQRLRELLRRR